MPSSSDPSRDDAPEAKGTLWSSPGLLEHHAELPSTMDRARELAAASCPDTPVTVLADVQTAGRGTRGRTWASPAGGLWMTTVVRTPPVIHFAPRAGMAVLGVLAELGGEDLAHAFRIKWPNDILIDHAKLSGVLIESAQSPAGAVTLVGVGVNLNVVPESPDPDTLFPPTSLALCTGRDFDIRSTAVALANAIHDTLSQPTPADAPIPQPELDAMNARLLRARVDTDEGPATIESVDPDGALRMRTDDGNAVLHRSGTLRFTL